MSEIKPGDTVRLTGEASWIGKDCVGVKLGSWQITVDPSVCEKIEPKGTEPSPGDLRTTYDDPRYSHYADQVFRSGEGWSGLSRMPLHRRKPSTDSRYVALCALEALKPNDADSRLAIWNAARVIRIDLRSDGSGGAGRNPHAAPPRKDDRA